MKGSSLKMFLIVRSGRKWVSTPMAVGWRMLRLSWRSCCKNEEQLVQNLSVWAELSPGKLFINNYRTSGVFLFTKNGIHILGLQDSVPREGNFWSCSALSQMPRQEPWQSPTPGSCTLVFHSVTGMGKLLGKRGLEAETELLRAENTDRVDVWGVHTASSSPMLKAGG